MADNTKKEGFELLSETDPVDGSYFEQIDRIFSAQKTTTMIKIDRLSLKLISLRIKRKNRYFLKY